MGTVAMTSRVDGQGPAKRGELFISRAGADKELAILIAHLLREAGYATFLQDEDFGHTNFMARVREGFAKVDNGGRMVTLLSNAYMQSDYCMAEADFALTGDPSNKKQRLIVLRIEDCAATGFLKGIPWAYNLVPILHDATALAQAVRGAIDPAAPEANYAAGLKYATTQILHLEIRPVPGFTGRADLLDAIDRALWQQGGAAALTNAQSAAVHGLGGVGKSVLAQEYAWRNRTRYRGVWWLRAETEQTLIDDLIALGSRLIPSLAEIPERERAAQLALDAIEQTGPEKPWLLVYDNAEKPTGLDKLTPRSGAHRLITSRWPGWKRHAEALAVDVFPPEVAIDFLMDGAAHPDRNAAARLAEALGFLPLALSHARAYCTSSNLPFDRYRARIAERIKDLPDGADYPASIFATFSLAMDKVAATCPEAETLMGTAAFLAPNRIPLDIITADVIGEDELNKAVAALYNVSLIIHETLDDASRGMSAHRLAQEVMRGRLGERSADNTLTALRLVRVALDAGDIREHTEWPRVQRLLPHAISVLEHVPDVGSGAEIAAAICASLDLYFDRRGEYRSAEAYSKRALTIREKALGPDHPDVGAYLNNLAQLYHTQGRYEEAEPLFKRALTIQEKALGPDHPSVQASLNNLAALYHAQGHYETVEPLFKRALAIGEKALGPDHPNVGLSLNNLAELYRAQGRYEAAEPLYERALTIREKALGPDHPDVGQSLNNLAELHRTQGRYEAAEPLWERVLCIWKKALGPDHPNVGASLNNLAGLYHTQGHYEAAEPLWERALAVWEKALGPDHPNVGLSLNNLAELYRAQAAMRRRNCSSNAPSRYLRRALAPIIQIRKRAGRIMRC